jgi:hypothetical protein
MKIGTEGELIMGGREFHGIRAATSKLRSPKPVRDLGTDNRERHGSAERKSLRGGEDH